MGTHLPLRAYPVASLPATADNGPMHDPRPLLRDPYIEWVQNQPTDGYDHDLGSSGLSVDWDWRAWGIDLAAMPAERPNWRGFEPLRARLAARLGLAVERLTVAPGTSGANALALSALVAPGVRVALEHPVYSPMAHLVRALGGEIVDLPRREALGWGFDPAALDNRLAGCGVCFVSNPHNPTGHLLDDAAIASLAGACGRAGATLVVDEVYREFPGADGVGTAAAHGDHVVVTSSLTKAYGLGGLRIGWIAGAPAFIDRVAEANHLLLGRGCVPSEWLADRVLANTDAFAALRADVARRAAAGRDVLDAFVARHEAVRWVRPTVGICGLVSLPEGTDGTAFAARCRDEARIYVVPGAFFGVPDAIRLSCGAAPDALAAGLDRLDPLVASLGG